MFIYACICLYINTYIYTHFLLLFLHMPLISKLYCKDMHKLLHLNSLRRILRYY